MCSSRSPLLKYQHPQCLVSVLRQIIIVQDIYVTVQSSGLYDCPNPSNVVLHYIDYKGCPKVTSKQFMPWKSFLW